MTGIFQSFEVMQFVLFAKYNYNNEVEEDEMGVACSTYVGEEECV
jgi:hypothetical protein